MYRNRLKNSPPKEPELSLKEKFSKYSLKKKVLLSLSFLIVLSYGLYYYDFIGSKNKYIYDPNLPMFKEFEWATWKDSAGGRMAHDHKWFKLPPEKYLTKEVPFDWNSVRGKSALVKRNAYFNHLCNTESISYFTEDMPEKELSGSHTTNKSLIYLRKATFPVKDMDKKLENMRIELENSKLYNKRDIDNKINEVFNRMLKIAQQNPYINPHFGFLRLSEGEERQFNLYPADKKFYGYNYSPDNFPSKNNFLEYMLDNGDIYQNKFDVKSQRFLPLIKMEESQAQYYRLYKEIERNKMHNLGIWGEESIIVNKENNKVVRYYKTFSVPAYLNSTRGSNFDIPINWKNRSSCIIEHKSIKEF